MDVQQLIASPETAAQCVQHVVRDTEAHLQAGRDTLVMTSRELITGADELSSLKIGAAVAEALVGVLQSIEVRPRYIIAKVCAYSRVYWWCLLEVETDFFPPLFPGWDYFVRCGDEGVEHEACYDCGPGCAGCAALAM